MSPPTEGNGWPWPWEETGACWVWTLVTPGSSLIERRGCSLFTRGTGASWDGCTACFSWELGTNCWDTGLLTTPDLINGVIWGTKMLARSTGAPEACWDWCNTWSTWKPGTNCRVTYHPLSDQLSHLSTRNVRIVYQRHRDRMRLMHYLFHTRSRHKLLGHRATYQPWPGHLRSRNVRIQRQLGGWCSVTWCRVSGFYVSLMWTTREVSVSVREMSASVGNLIIYDWKLCFCHSHFFVGRKFIHVDLDGCSRTLELSLASDKL